MHQRRADELQEILFSHLVLVMPAGRLARKQEESRLIDGGVNLPQTMWLSLLTRFFVPCRRTRRNAKSLSENIDPLPFQQGGQDGKGLGLSAYTQRVLDKSRPLIVAKNPS